MMTTPISSWVDSVPTINTHPAVGALEHRTSPAACLFKVSWFMVPATSEGIPAATSSDRNNTA